jgi:ABC-type polysaccharide/polyol phosphate export permease
MYLGVQDIKARFRRSFLGPIWLLLNMGLFVAGAGVLYGVMIHQPMKEFLPYLTAGFAIWGFLASSLTESGMAFIIAEGYIKQFCYPKQIYLLRMLVSQTIVLLIYLSTLIPVQLLLGSLSPLGWLLILPGLALLLLAGLGHTFLSAYLSVRFRDLPHAAGGLLQVAFFVTPVMFPIKVLQERGLSFVFQLNPFHYLIDIVRYPIMNGTLAPAQNYGFAFVYILIVWALAFLVARSLDSRIVVLL